MSDARNYGSVVNETLRQVAFGTQTAVPEVQVDDLVCDNKVTTSKYTAANFLFKSLALQFRRFANIYFVVQTIIMMVGWYTNLFGAPFSPWSMLGMLVFVLGIVMVFEARDDLFRHAQDKALNERKQAIFRVEDGRVQAKTVAWQDIRVGDILLVKNKESFAADLVLLASSEDSGICYVETSNIDGETNLKLHLSNEAISFPIKKGCDNKADNVLAFLSMCQFECSVEKPNQVVTNFNGSAKFSCPGRDNSKPIPLSFSNFLLRGAQLRNTQWVLGLVVYTGAQTKVMMNSRETASKMSSIEQMVNHTLYTIVFAQCALVTITDVAKLVWDAEYLTDTSGYWYLFPPGGELQSYIFPDWLANWLTYFILFNNFVPINLYAVMEFCNLLQGYFINMDAKMYDPNTDTAARARSSNLCQELGQVEYIFSDKTGTLTQNVMKLMRCSVGDRIYGALSNGSFTNAAKEMSTALKTPGETANTIDMLFTVLAVAHTVVIEAQGDGDFIYQAESPDEAALVQGAAEVGYRFVGRRGNVCNLMVNGVSRSYEILAVNVFNSTRKRMSVVVRDDAKTYHLFVKGADNVMFDRASAPASERIDSHLNEFAQEGLRTLVMGYRALDEKEFFAWQAEYDEASNAIVGRADGLMAVAEKIEKNLTILGATAVEDKLQDGVPETISDLAQAGIKLWVLTGDKLETAINIGFSCKLLKPTGMTILRMEETTSGSISATMNKFANQTFSEEMALVITGACLAGILDSQPLTQSLLALTSRCSVVVACRVSPLQKALLVRMVKEGISPSPITLGIGDGANDVGMIMEAHVGIGISGKEGLQAVNASDFAIAQFRFLKRLLLVHGRWNYRRMCKVVVYSFYKNFCITLTLFYYCFSNGLSGTSLYEELMYTGFNLFTFLPICVIGVLDQDVKAETAEKYPVLYMTGRLKLDLNLRVVVEAIFLALVHSVIIYVWPAYAFPGLELSNLDGLFVFGTTVFACLFFAMQGRAALITSTWTSLHVYTHLFCFFLYFLFLVSYSAMYDLSADFYFVGYKMMSQGIFWIVLFGVPFTALSFDYFIEYLKREYFPTLMDLAIEMDNSMKSSHRIVFPSIREQIENQARRVGEKISTKRSSPPEEKPSFRNAGGTEAVFSYNHPESFNDVRRRQTLGHSQDISSLDSNSMNSDLSSSGLSNAPAVESKNIVQVEVKELKVLKNKPKESELLQQNLMAWRPVLSVSLTIRAFLLLGIIFFTFGAAVLSASDQVDELIAFYAGQPESINLKDPKTIAVYDDCFIGSQCNVTFTVPEAGMKAPIFVLYQLEGVYQNYLSYVNSKDDDQLMGYDSSGSCQDAEYLTAPDGREYLPCGSQAHTMFNDSFALSSGSYILNETGIAWASDLQIKFNNPNNYPATCSEDSLCLSEYYSGLISEEEGVKNEHFVVWMRLAALPNFRKSFGIINEDLPGNAQLNFTIDNRWPVASFNGTKALVITTTSWIGGKNTFLGAAFLAFGVLNFCIGLLIATKECVRPRSKDIESEFNDMSVSLLPKQPRIFSDDASLIEPTSSVMTL